MSMTKPISRPRTWGFRFLLTDAIVIAIVVLSALFLKHFDNPLWWLLLIVAGHFFLFCNVFRERRRFEFVWAGFFIVNAGVWLLFENLVLTNVIAFQLPITLACVISEMRSPYYHGICASRMNRRLNDYLECRI